MSFSMRLKEILHSKNLSQGQAAKICGISQQSIHYIIKSNLSNSKLAPQIASALNINSDWLIYGLGKPDLLHVSNLPILHSVHMLKKFLQGNIEIASLDLTIIDTYLGDNAFSYLFKPKEMLICADNTHQISNTDYLTLHNDEIIITKQPKKLSFPIFERRKRCEDF